MANILYAKNILRRALRRHRVPLCVILIGLVIIIPFLFLGNKGHSVVRRESIAGADDPVGRFEELLHQLPVRKKAGLLNDTSLMVDGNKNLVLQIKPFQLVAQTLMDHLEDYYPKIRNKSRPLQKINNITLVHLKHVCPKMSVWRRTRKPQSRFLLSEKDNLLYCKVSGAGPKFWNQLFSSILYPEKFPKSNPILYGTPRWEIDFGNNIVLPSIHWDEAVRISSRVTRFIFTSDPYSRLWNIYIETFWLPKFWSRVRIGKHKTYAFKDRCLWDVSFTDFLAHATHGHFNNANWAPVHELCNPCEFKPDFIGNMRTFVQDVRNLLQPRGLDSVLSEINNKTWSSLEVELVIKFHYELLNISSKMFNYCEFTEKNMAYRLWRTLQIKGYIGDQYSFIEYVSEYDEASFQEAVLAVVSKFPLSEKESSLQRASFLHIAYRSVPYNITARIRKRFRDDFDVFNFDRFPNYLLEEEDPVELFDW